MPNNEDVVAAYSAHTTAEHAVRILGKSGFDIRTLSIVVKDYHFEERILGFYGAGDRIRHWSVWGVLLGCALGFLLSATLVVIPGLMPELGRNSASPTLAIGVVLGGAGIIGGLGALCACAYSMTVPKDSVLKYDLSIERTDELLLVSRSPAEAAIARRIIEAAHAVELAAPPDRAAPAYDLAGG